MARAVAHLVEQQNADGSWDGKGIYGHRISVRVLSEVSPLSELFSVVRAGALSQSGNKNRSEFRAFRKCPDRTASKSAAARELGESMRYPLKMTANLAKYVATQALSRRARNFPW